MLATRVDRVRQEGRARTNDTNRDITIQVHNVEIENLLFSVQQGVAFEQAFASLALEQQRLLLAVAQNNRDTAIAVLNARIAVFNAKLQGYQTEAQVFEARVRAELAKAEVYRAQIDGERARGEINEQRVRLYSEQIRAVQTSAELYRTQVQAIQTEVETAVSMIPIRMKALRWTGPSGVRSCSLLVTSRTSRSKPIGRSFMNSDFCDTQFQLDQNEPGPPANALTNPCVA
jgi:hypothetical protein